MTAAEAFAAEPLPELRPELQVLEAASGRAGERRWLIFDPLQNQYFQIDAAAHRALSHWQLSRSPADLVARAAAAGDAAIDLSGIGALIEHLRGHRLTLEPPGGGWRKLAAAAAPARGSLLAAAAKSYLFFRIPLWRPQRFLERTLPAVRWLGSYGATLAFVSIAAAGLYLVSRQWEAFLATFAGFMSWQGVVQVAIVLAIVKSAHELGHAWTAVRYGCHVPTIGVAIIVMAPMLYTDVTDAWRLRDRRQRLAIDTAGVRVELTIAGVALFLWSFLPDGTVRSLAFLVSTASLATSLVVNLNPFMRFDGYYVLAELLAVENLQPRAFALASWHLREALFGLGHPAPDEVPRQIRIALILYAYLTWAYRLAVFIGIALLVYHYFFKLLGLVLFAVEIVYFILRPIWWELRMWWRLKGEILRRRRWLVPAAASALGVLTAVVPWSSRISVPAVVEAAGVREVHATQSGRIVGVHARHGRVVAPGEPLVTLASPDIARETELATTRLRLARLQHARRGADAADRESSLILESAIASLVSRLEGLERERQSLVVRAPMEGRILELNPHLHPGRWIGPKEAIAVIGARTEIVVRGYVSEADVARIALGDRARFVPEHLQRPSFDLVVTDIGLGSTGHIEIAELSSVHDGPITVATDAKGRHVPTSAQYAVVFRISSQSAGTELAVRGLALVEGRPESLLARIWRRTLQVLVRESGA